MPVVVLTLDGRVWRCKRKHLDGSRGEMAFVDRAASDGPCMKGLQGCVIVDTSRAEPVEAEGESKSDASD